MCVTTISTGIISLVGDAIESISLIVVDGENLSLRLCYGVLERKVLCWASHPVGNRTDTLFSEATDSKRIGIAKFQPTAISEDSATHARARVRQWHRRARRHLASAEVLSRIAVTLCKRPLALIQIQHSLLLLWPLENFCCAYTKTERSVFIFAQQKHTLVSPCPSSPNARAR